MVQPKYSPEEALQRIKLMMKYDTSKTLNENKELVSEALPLAALAALPWLKIGAGAAVAGIGTWIYNVQGGGDSFQKTKSFFEGCTKLDKNLKPLQGKQAHRDAAYSIYNAIEGFGTDEDAIRAALSSMESIADLCAMHKFYTRTYGDLYKDLDGDLDGEDFRKYVWSAIAPLIDDAEDDLEQSKQEDAGGGEEKKDGKAAQQGGGYRDCAGSYSFGCKTSPQGAIGQVQACIGVDVDGKFGPNTRKALNNKGYTSFTDDEVSKICGKQQSVQTPQQDEYSVQVDYDSIEDILK
jgi:hypothetical protein